MFKQIVVFTGAGVSAESGIKTFRDSDGLWEQYNINDVATPEAWRKNSELVLEFYNARRKQILEAKPNAAHIAIAKLQKHFKVQVITQNIDNLHERAGSKNVLHLHGEITKSRSTANPQLIYPIKGASLNLGDTCKKGSQLRPHIVWFGEEVPEMVNAYKLAAKADLFIVIGTSLNVYPAAGLINYAPPDSLKYLVDPFADLLPSVKNLTLINKPAGIAIPALVDELIGMKI